jgi:hypothetical protein
MEISFQGGFADGLTQDVAAGTEQIYMVNDITESYHGYRVAGNVAIFDHVLVDPLNPANKPAPYPWWRRFRNLLRHVFRTTS